MGFGKGIGFTPIATVIVIGVARSSPAIVASGKAPAVASATPAMELSSTVTVS